jgi:hypothetical protein
VEKPCRWELAPQHFLPLVVDPKDINGAVRGILNFEFEIDVAAFRPSDLWSDFRSVLLADSINPIETGFNLIPALEPSKVRVGGGRSLDGWIGRCRGRSWNINIAKSL